MNTVLVVVDEGALRKEIRAALEGVDFTVVECSDGLRALGAAFEARPDAVIADLNVPGLNGIEFVRVFRAACDVPIVALGSDGSATFTARVLDAGADDFMHASRPVSELVARLRSTVRVYGRAPRIADSRAVVATGGMVVDRDAYEVTMDGEQVRLTPTEFRLLETLAAHLGQVVPHRVLLQHVWRDSEPRSTGYLRVYVGYLRAKLADDPARPTYIFNHWGLGYRLAKLPPIEGTESRSGPELPRPMPHSARLARV